jgi:electron transfer flavoprotein-quinone oxidoreductase
MILELVNGKMRVTDQRRCMGCFGCEDECAFDAVRVLRAPQSVVGIQIEPPPQDADRCDVAIVGAGPSGLGAAITCAKAGLNTLVFERLPNRKISHHTDGGVLFTFPWLTSIQVEDDQVRFPELDIAINASFAHKCGSLGLLGPEGLSTDNRFPAGTEGWAGNKDKFVEALVEAAESAGARIWFNAKVVDVLKEGNRVTGVKLDTGEEISAQVVVTADGALAKISQKAGMQISQDDLWYASVLAYEYPNNAGLPAGLYYLNGGMRFEEEMPTTFGGIGITEVIHVMLIFLSRKRTHAAPKPMDYYLERLLASDPRIEAKVGSAVRGHDPTMVTGCRAVFRAECNLDTVGEGVISVGDAWVDDGEIGNVTALANGVHAGRVIIEAIEKGDLSKAALSPANDFLTPQLVRILAQNKRMKLLETQFDAGELEQMFAFMQHMNYPVMMFGSSRQQVVMFAKFTFKNFLRFLRYPKIAKAFF